MKKLVVLFAILMFVLPACGSANDPRALAEADAIRTRAAQDAADRAAARSAPAPVIVQAQSQGSDWFPWMMFSAAFGGLVICLMVIFLMGIARSSQIQAQNDAPPAGRTFQVVQQRVIIDKIGRGQYRITENNATRLLDWSNPVDAQLLNEVSHE